MTTRINVEATHRPTNYRPDIDGLRAVAVLAVVLYHAFPYALPGGFVGVDIFFVISGYLITSIIGKQIGEGTFRLSDFYVRRIKRIFPALIVVLLASLLLGWRLLLDDEFKALGRSALAGAAFFANLHLYSEIGYFDTVAHYKPLLHLWSLGVEEQFYLLWPILLILAHRARINLLLVALVGLACSFALNIHFVELDRARTFYLPDTRFWELLAGAVLALYGTRTALKERTANYMSTAGACLLAAGLILVSKDDYFPGWWAVLPVSGAFLLIAAGSDAWVNRRILQTRWLVFIGLISFPLYLWHWPLLVFGQFATNYHLTRWGTGGLVITSMVLAWLTYRAIERPVRFGILGKSGARTASALAGVLMLVGGTAYLITNGTLVAQSKSPEIERMVEASKEWDFPGDSLKPLEFGGVTFYIEPSKKPETTLLIGDSNIQQYSPRIVSLISSNPNHANTAVFATGGGCPPIPNIEEKDHPGCQAILKAAMEYARRDEVKTVVISALWYAYFLQNTYYDYQYKTADGSEKLNPGTRAERNALASLTRMISEMTENGKKVFLVTNIPTGEQVDPKKRVVRSLLAGASVNTVGMPTGPFLARYGHLRDQLMEVARLGGGVYIDPVDHLCDEVRCPVVTTAGDPMYKDGDHLRPGFVRTSVTYLDRTILTH